MADVNEDFIASLLGSRKSQGFGYATAPGELPTSPVTPAVGSSPPAGFGFSSFLAGLPQGHSLATTLAMLAKAFAPHQTDKFGHVVPSVQEKIATGVGQFSQGQLMAQALKQGKSPQVDPFIAYYLNSLKGGGL